MSTIAPPEPDLTGDVYERLKICMGHIETLDDWAKEYIRKHETTGIAAKSHYWLMNRVKNDWIGKWTRYFISVVKQDGGPVLRRADGMALVRKALSEPDHMDMSPEAFW